jgi:hypothetical protein
MKRLIQILTVTFAVSMLAAYVAYSQKQHNRTIASGSKVAAPPEPSKPAVAQTNAPSTPPAAIVTLDDNVVMSSSKSMILIVNPTTVSNLQSGPTDSNWISAMTSKSGHVFGQGAVRVTQPSGLAPTNPIEAAHFSHTQTNNAKTNILFSKEP